MAADHSRTGHLGQGLFADEAIVAELLDIEETPVGGKADRLQAPAVKCTGCRWRMCGHRIQACG